jgi:hypothetical protein
MAVMVIGEGRPPIDSVMGKKKSYKAIGEDSEESEGEESSGGTGVKEHAAGLVADALGIDANPRELAKALESFVNACKGG